MQHTTRMAWVPGGVSLLRTYSYAGQAARVLGGCTGSWVLGRLYGRRAQQDRGRTKTYDKSYVLYGSS